MNKTYTDTELEIAGPDETFNDVAIQEVTSPHLLDSLGSMGMILSGMVVLGAGFDYRDSRRYSRDVLYADGSPCAIRDERHDARDFDRYLSKQRALEKHEQARVRVRNQATDAKKLAKRKAANAARSRNKGR